MESVQVLDTCIAGGYPVLGLNGGGYASDLDVLARRHVLLSIAAKQMWADHAMAARQSHTWL